MKDDLGGSGFLRNSHLWFGRCKSSPSIVQEYKGPPWSYNHPSQSDFWSWPKSEHQDMKTQWMLGFDPMSLIEPQTNARGYRINRDNNWCNEQTCKMARRFHRHLNVIRIIITTIIINVCVGYFPLGIDYSHTHNQQRCSLLQPR